MAKKILVADDEMDILKVVVFRLKKAGFDVTAVSDGKKALESIAAERPDLILLDFRMPVMDGLETCQAIKSDNHFKDIPVIFLTASTGEEAAQQAREAGAEYFMTKPFDFEELKSRIESVLSS